MKLLSEIIFLLCAAHFSAIAADTRAGSAALQAHIEFLADDLLEGRETGTRGYNIAAKYVASQFAMAGLMPVGDRETYMQRVPVRSALLDADSAVFEIIGPNGVERFKYGEDAVVFPSRQLASSDATAEIVYAGHGIVAPRFGIDDFANLDVAGKFVLVLAGAPNGLPGDEAAHFANLRLKQDLAASRGAIGLITLQTPANEKTFRFAQHAVNLRSRSYAWLDDAGKPHGGGTAVPYTATVSIVGSDKLLARAGTTLMASIERAEKKLSPSSLGFSATLHIARTSQLHEALSSNVVGMIEGSDASLKREYIVLTAHLDHLGIAQGKSGDNIHNGALDNAAGVAVLMESARLIAAMPIKPKRSILFAAVTGEEAGQLGSEYFVNRAKAAGLILVANINVDMPILLYNFRDVFAFGAEHSTVGDTVASVARSMNISVSVDPQPAKRRFTRSDQYSFVKAGIPAVSLTTGLHSTEEDGVGTKAREAFELAHYHRVSDDTSRPIHYDAGAKLANLHAAIAFELANAPASPKWKAGSFFGDTFGRDQMRSR